MARRTEARDTWLTSGIAFAFELVPGGSSAAAAAAVVVETMEGHFEGHVWTADPEKTSSLPLALMMGPEESTVRRRRVDEGDRRLYCQELRQQ